jgi:3-hydroxymyristoyl/3-hydroxydecanoyl-(acyl carrier protein) dehydratase
MDALTLPLDQRAIQQILPHRYPFLLVDRITELEPDKRIVGIKNVSINDHYLSHAAQVGAILILSKP